MRTALGAAPRPAAAPVPHREHRPVAVRRRAGAAPRGLGRARHRGHEPGKPPPRERDRGGRPGPPLHARGGHPHRRAVRTGAGAPRPGLGDVLGAQGGGPEGHGRSGPAVPPPRARDRRGRPGRDPGDRRRPADPQLLAAAAGGSRVRRRQRAHLPDRAARRPLSRGAAGRGLLPAARGPPARPARRRVGRRGLGAAAEAGPPGERHGVRGRARAAERPRPQRGLLAVRDPRLPQDAEDPDRERPRVPAVRRRRDAGGGAGQRDHGEALLARPGPARPPAPGAGRRTMHRRPG